MKTRIICLSIALAFTMRPASADAAASYVPGDVVDDFVWTRRDTGQPLRLSEFAGKIVFLDWFAWWCPFCQAAAPQLLEGIDHWYAERGGNPDGIEVVHVGVNLQPNQEAQTANFVRRAGLELVVQDFDRAVANRFFPQGGQPIFAIVNLVADSPSHANRELLYSRLGYGERDFPVAEFRAAIDAVRRPAAQPAAPRLAMPSRAPDGATVFVLEGEAGRTYRIESSGDLRAWSPVLSVTPAGASETVRVPPDSGPAPRFFRAVTP